MPRFICLFSLIALSLCVIPAIAQEPQLSNPPTLEELQRACADFRPGLVVDALRGQTYWGWESLDHVSRMTATGDQDWLDVFSNCIMYGSGDGSWTMYQYNTLALTIPNNPNGVLAVLQGDHSIFADDACSLDFIEARYEDMVDLGQRSLDALATVTDLGLSETRDRCIQEINTAMEREHSLFEQGFFNRPEFQ